MNGFQCDNCLRFAPIAVSQNGMYQVQAMPPGWITLQEEKPAASPYSGLLATLSSVAPDAPQLPQTFCTPECCRDWLRARTLIEGAAAS